MDRQKWNDFVLKHGPRSGRFLQSWEWGEFQKAVGEHVEYRQLEEGGEVTAQTLWLRRHLPVFGEYWYAPRGPIAQSMSGETLQKLTDKGPFFLRVDPEKLDDLSAKKSINLQPAVTNILDLSKSEEELLAGMHHKTRYNIRLATRKGVHVTLAETKLDDVWSLFEQTGSRGGFRLHPRGYYEKQLETLSGGECCAFLASAYYENHPIATTVMIDFGDTRTYVHGASEREHRKLMAPALLHWELIRDAKHKGLKWYDWWGVAPEGAKNHPWEGISRFKRGYGGEDVQYPGTHDVVQKSLTYSLYKIARQVRRSI